MLRHQMARALAAIMIGKRQQKLLMMKKCEIDSCEIGWKVLLFAWLFEMANSLALTSSLEAQRSMLFEESDYDCGMSLKAGSLCKDQIDDALMRTTSQQASQPATSGGQRTRG